MTFQEQLSKAFELFEKNRLNESLTTFRHIEKEIQSVDDDIAFKMNYGYILAELNFFAEAHRNYQSLEKIGKQLNDYEIIAQSLHQQGMVYRKQKEYTTAIKYFVKAQRINKVYLENNILHDAANLYEIGYCSLLQKNYRRSIYNLNKSLVRANESEDLIMIACSYRGLGEYYLTIGNKKKGLEFLDKAKGYFIQSKDSIGASEIDAIVDTFNNQCY